MNDLSIGWLVFIVSVALIPQAVWLWWKDSLLRKKSIQSEVISLEQQYAEDIKLGKAVVVSEVINKIYWSQFFLFITTTLIMVFFLISNVRLLYFKSLSTVRWSSWIFFAKYSVCIYYFI